MSKLEGGNDGVVELEADDCAIDVAAFCMASTMLVADTLRGNLERMYPPLMLLTASSTGASSGGAMVHWNA